MPRLVKLARSLPRNSYTSTVRSRCLVFPENRISRMLNCFKINVSSRRTFSFVTSCSLLPKKKKIHTRDQFSRIRRVRGERRVTCITSRRFNLQLSAGHPLATERTRDQEICISGTCFRHAPRQSSVVLAGTTSLTRTRRCLAIWANHSRRRRPNWATQAPPPCQHL